MRVSSLLYLDCAQLINSWVIRWAKLGYQRIHTWIEKIDSSSDVWGCLTSSDSTSQPTAQRATVDGTFFGFFHQFLSQIHVALAGTIVVREHGLAKRERERETAKHKCRPMIANDLWIWLILVNDGWWWLLMVTDGQWCGWNSGGSRGWIARRTAGTRRRTLNSILKAG